MKGNRRKQVENMRATWATNAAETHAEVGGETILCEGKLISENSLEISIKFLGLKPVRELRPAIRPNHEPLRGSAQVVPDYVTSVVRKRERTNRDTEQLAGLILEL